MSLPTLASLLAVLIAGGASALLYGQNQDLEARLAALEGPRAEPGAASEAAPGSGPGLSGGGLQRDVAELLGLAEGLVRRMDVLEREPAGTSAVPVVEQVAALTQSGTFSNAVREVVLDMATNDVDFRARVGSSERAAIPKNAPFSKVADTLKLDASQEDRMSRDLQAMQQELFTLLGEERADGVRPLEIIAKAEELKEGDPKKAEHFIKLFTLKIPGGEETYMQRAVALQTAFRKQTLKYLRPEQNEIWDAMQVDWYSIKFN
jgi:hypothetical protein